MERFAGISMVNLELHALHGKVAQSLPQKSGYDAVGMARVILDMNSTIRQQAIRKLLHHLQSEQFSDALFTLNNYNCFSNYEKKQLEELISSLDPQRLRDDSFGEPSELTDQFSSQKKKSTTGRYP